MMLKDRSHNNNEMKIDLKKYTKKSTMKLELQKCVVNNYYKMQIYESI